MRAYVTDSIAAVPATPWGGSAVQGRWRRSVQCVTAEDAAPAEQAAPASRQNGRKRASEGTHARSRAGGRAHVRVRGQQLSWVRSQLARAARLPHCARHRRAAGWAVPRTRGAGQVVGAVR